MEGNTTPKENASPRGNATPIENFTALRFPLVCVAIEQHDITARILH